jgi:hypothetical protein
VTDGLTRQEKRQREERQREAEDAARVREIHGLSDDEVVARAGQYGQAAHYAVVMQRRLKDTTERLTAETIKSRESSERLTSQLDASIASLTAETVKAARASDRAARRLVWLTVVLVVFTAALVALTVVLAVRN